MNNSKAPILSVILPAYNAERYIVESIESVLNQTMGDFELIVVDDGSTDRTLAILRDFEKRDPRVKIVSRPNTGIVGALNDGLKAARGEFIARHDADDVCLPQRFELQLKYMQEHPECDCVGCHIIAIEPFGTELFTSTHKLTHEEIDANILRGNGFMMVHSAAMLRHSTLKKLGGYRQEFNFLEDADLFLRLAEIGRLANLPQALHKVRMHTQSVTKVRADLQARLWDQCIRQTYARRGLTLPPDWKFVPKRPLPRSEQLREWAWRALKAKNKKAARSHALGALKAEPTNKENWKVLFCSFRGR